MKNLLCLLFLSVALCVSYGFSGPEKEDEALRESSYKIFQELYRFRFQTVDSLIKETRRNFPEKPLPYLLSVNYYWWLIISGEDNFENRKNFYLDLNLAQQKMGKKKAPLSNEDIYTFINIYSYKARIEGLNKNYLKAVSHTNACVEYLKKSFGKEKEYEYFYLTSGLYNYYITDADEEYPILKPYLLLYPKGNLKTGIEYLQTASRSADFALNTEANYFLSKIYLEQKNYETAILYCRLLNKKYPTNLLYKYYLFKAYLDHNEKDRALEILKEMNVQTLLNEQLSAKQKQHFISMAQKKLEKYYETKGARQ